MEKTILFTGGGTGGHVYPALAVYELLKENWDGKFVWIGSKNGMERRILEEYNDSIEYRPISSGKFRRYFSFKNVTDLFKITAGILQSISLLRKIKPKLIFSKGGFVSVPPVIAAGILGIPAVTHESDFDPGLATRINSRMVRKIYVTYQETVQFLNPGLGDKIMVTGNPVRPDILSGSRERGLSIFDFTGDKPILLILGGSQGSREINNLLRKSLEELLSVFDVIHQVGKEMEKGNHHPLPGYVPIAYLKDEYPDAAAAADIVLSRAGAGTLWEFSALGKPLVLLPLSVSSSRGDQIRNAQYFKERGAAEVLENNPDPEHIVDTLFKLMRNPKALDKMGKASYALGGAKAASTIVGDCLNILNEVEPIK